MADSPQIGRLQSRKTILLAVFSGSLSLAAITSLLRFDRSINNAISGPAKPMEVIARRFAQNMAEQTDREFPVIVVNDESAGWEKLKDARMDIKDDVFYVFSYSERAHSVCLIAYAPVGDAPAVGDMVTLRPGEGENYGRAFTVPVRVVSTGRFVKVFTEAFLSLMDWNQEIKLTDGIVATSSRRSVPATAAEMSLDVSLNVFDLRAEVGRKHNLMNRWLLLGMGMFLGLAMLSAAFVRAAYATFRRQCQLYDFDLNLRAYLVEDLRSISDCAQAEHLARQQQLGQQLRAVTSYRRTTEEAARRLRSLLELQTDHEQRIRIQECLDRCQLDEMNALWDEFQTETSQRTPEERLALLVESLKEYCSEEEVENCRSEASTILQNMGFRPARDFVVRMHDEFRMRAREAEREALAENMKDSA